MAIDFIPVRAEEDVIQSMAYNEGYLYFAKDTGKIFLDVDGERKTMGGAGVAVFYAEDQNVEMDASDHYAIARSSLYDSQASPKENDLIINIPNGYFYRVLEVEDSRFICSVLAVSGSGGGGGGGGGTDDPSKPKTYVTLEQITPVFPQTFIYGQDYNITYKATAPEDRYINIQITVTDGVTNKNTYYTYRATSGVNFDLNIGSYLPQSDVIRIVVQATSDNTTNTAEKRYTGRSSITLALKKVSDFNPKDVYGTNNKFLFKCMPVGAVTKKLEIFVDDVLSTSATIESAISDSLYTIGVDNQTHGAHTVKAQLSAEINGTTVTTDPIEYEIAWKEDGDNTPIIWCPNLYSTTLVQYEDLNIPYMVYVPGKEKDIEVAFYKGGELVMNRSVTYSADTMLNWSITDYVVGTNNYAIVCGSARKNLTVIISKDTVRNMEILTGGLVLNLDSSGRSNEEYPSSRSSWVSKDTPVATAVRFKDFNWYNNGWITDEDGRSCLRVSNGASIEIPISSLGGGIFTSQKATQALAFEFRFKLRNVRRYNTLIRYELENEIPVQKVTGDEAWCKYYNTMGFCIGTQEAFIKSSNSTVSAKYKEDEFISLTFVVDSMNEKYPLLYIYLNGILSGITQYGDSDTFNANETLMRINSDYCDVDLYKIRIYKNVKLNSADVVHNYIADLKDSKEYDINQITTTTNNVPTIDYNKMLTFNATHPDETIIPYMVIESKDNILPYVKGGTKVVHIEFTNPALDYAYDNGFIDAKTYMMSAPSFKYEQDFTNEKAKGSLNVQGTSSQGYPRRNFKWKGKQKDATWIYTHGPAEGQPVYQYDKAASEKKGKDVYSGAKLEDGTEIKKWHLDSNIGETTFCFKADYMESSGTYNTGFASFVKEMYDKHPLSDYGFSDTNDYRTTIYGFPILVFQKTGDKQYDFVGRYNLNLDKGCSDSYGFTYDADSKVPDSEGGYKPIEEVAECWELTNNQGGRCSFQKVDFEETVDSYISATGVTADNFADGTYYLQQAKTDGTGYNYILAKEFSSKEVYYVKQSGSLALLGDFEYRYSYFADDIDDCIDGVGDFAGSSQEERNAFLLDKYKNLKEISKWLCSTSLKNVPTVPLDLPEPVTYGSKTYTKDDTEYRKAKFLAEFNDHFDAEYCEVYYIMTELLHLYDSRGKNLMMATWGPKKEGGNYIWYPIFYDIDTQLGINNSGVPTWNYAAEPSKDNNFSTSDSVLWTNLWECFKNNILARYVTLRKNKLSIAEVNAYYNGYPIASDPSINSWKQIEASGSVADLQKQIKSYGKIGKKPIMTYNVDQYYKYISPTLTGFINTSGNTVQDSGSFFYCLQGSRDLSRYLYLRNRFNFVDSSWHGGAYAIEASKTEYWSRYDANYPGMTSDSYVMTDDPALVGTKKEFSFNVGSQSAKGEFTYTDTSGHPLDCVGDYLNVKSYLSQYMSLQLDETLTEAVPCDGENPINLMLPEDVRHNVKYSPGLTQQLVYIGGGEYISDLGDLSLKYLDELHIPTLKRLNSLILGNDIPGYFNNQLNPTNFVLGDSAYINGQPNENAKSLLERVVLNGLGGLTAPIDVTGSEKLKEFRALRTKITGVQLADGVQIEMLHLPESVTTLKLTEPVALKNILTAPTTDVDGETTYNKGLYIEGLTDIDEDDITLTSATHLNEINIIGGNFGYDSYRLLRKTVKIKQQMQLNPSLPDGYDKKLNISLTDVKWSPYETVAHGEPYDASKTYYIDNDRYELIVYTGGEEGWDYNTSNGKIYEYVPNATNEATITDLDMFKDFIDNYKEALDFYNNHDYSEAMNYFRDASSTGVTLPEITGIIYVNNTTPLEEFELANTFSKNFPSLKIFAKNVTQCYVSQFVSVVDGTETTVYSERISESTEDAHVSYPDPTIYAPIKFNYDFKGWNTSPDAIEPLTQEEIEAMKFDSEHTIYKFYAIFSIHNYNINFFTYNFKTQQSNSIITLQVPAGSYLFDIGNVPLSPNEKDLELRKRYKFLGWVTDPLNCYPADESEGVKYIIQLETIQSEGRDRNFYACFIEEGVDSLTDEKYFDFSAKYGTGVMDMSYTDPDGNLLSGYAIMPKAGQVLSGKITLPTTHNNEPIVGIMGFSNMTDLTHIFWSGEDNLIVIGSSRDLTGAFQGCSSLVYFEMPSTLKEIGYGAFSGTNMDLSLIDLASAKSLTQLDGRAFMGADQNNRGKLTITLPGKLKTLTDRDFSNLRNCDGIDTVQLGAPGDPSQLTKMGAESFYFSNTEKTPRNWVVYVSSSSRAKEIEALIDAHTASSSASSPPNKNFVTA